jgi:YggT family protein
MGMNPIIWLLHTLLTVYFWIVLAWVIMSILVSFNIINIYQPFANRVYHGLRQLVEPTLEPIRKILPPMGGFDISPIILVIGIQFIQYCLVYYF